MTVEVTSSHRSLASMEVVRVPADGGARLTAAAAG